MAAPVRKKPRFPPSMPAELGPSGAEAIADFGSAALGAMKAASGPEARRPQGPRGPRRGPGAAPPREATRRNGKTGGQACQRRPFKVLKRSGQALRIRLAKPAPYGITPDTRGRACSRTRSSAPAPGPPPRGGRGPRPRTPPPGPLCSCGPSSRAAYGASASISRS
jgi:hypothetical protein